MEYKTVNHIVDPVRPKLTISFKLAKPPSTKQSDRPHSQPHKPTSFIKRIDLRQPSRPQAAAQTTSQSHSNPPIQTHSFPASHELSGASDVDILDVDSDESDIESSIENLSPPSIHSIVRRPNVLIIPPVSQSLAISNKTKHTARTHENARASSAPVSDSFDELSEFDSDEHKESTTAQYANYNQYSDDDDGGEQTGSERLMARSGYTSASSRTSIRNSAASATLNATKPKRPKSRGKGFSRKRKERPADGISRSTKRRKLPLEQVLSRMIDMIRQKDSYGFFLEPVDPNIVTDYSTVIREPMDLSTMANKVASNLYSSCAEFCKDFELVIKNAKTYNSKATLYYKEAEKLDQAGQRIIQRESVTIESAEERQDRLDQMGGGSEMGNDLDEMDGADTMVRTTRPYKKRDMDRKKYPKKIPHVVDLEEAMSLCMHSDGTFVRGEGVWKLPPRTGKAFTPSLPRYPAPPLFELSPLERAFATRFPRSLCSMGRIDIHSISSLSWTALPFQPPVPASEAWINQWVYHTHGNATGKSFVESMDRFSQPLSSVVRDEVASQANYITDGTYDICKAIHKLCTKAEIKKESNQGACAQVDAEPCIIHSTHGQIDIVKLLRLAQSEVDDVICASTLVHAEKSGSDITVLHNPIANAQIETDVNAGFKSCSVTDLLKHNAADILALIDKRKQRVGAGLFHLTSTELNLAETIRRRALYLQSLAPQGEFHTVASYNTSRKSIGSASAKALGLNRRGSQRTPRASKSLQSSVGSSVNAFMSALNPTFQTAGVNPALHAAFNSSLNPALNAALNPALNMALMNPTYSAVFNSVFANALNQSLRGGVGGHHSNTSSTLNSVPTPLTSNINSHFYNPTTTSQLAQPTQQQIIAQQQQQLLLDPTRRHTPSRSMRKSSSQTQLNTTQGVTHQSAQILALASMFQSNPASMQALQQQQMILQQKQLHQFQANGVGGFGNSVENSSLNSIGLSSNNTGLSLHNSVDSTRPISIMPGTVCMSCNKALTEELDKTYSICQACTIRLLQDQKFY
ncbi:hypothetical protein BDEG_24384 [Batrachochytrium dendrobatidis JEL423]|uniref:Bromo domain-containing protein n=2 Tax=Batrachochytrium dendrobatidis TaxID=109871 RepID=A0A177WKQ0_BATDL|nr:hypothetical protein BDEG_24384 [Batrachochytrium dendrobatidis JEL423]